MKKLYLMKTFSGYSGGCYIVAADNKTEAKNIMITFAREGFDDLFNHQEDIQEKCFEENPKKTPRIYPAVFVKTLIFCSNEGID